jgi:MYXO-CTERM domain-containing protein
VPFFSEGPVWCGALCSASATSNCYQGCGGCDFVDFACQPYDGGGASLCVPSCFSDSDCDYLPGAHCDALGVCTSAQTEDAGAETSPPAKGGCGCGTASASDVALGLGLGLAALVRRRRR